MKPGYVTAGSWTLTARIEPTGLYFQWLGRAWRLPALSVEPSQFGDTLVVTLTLHDGLLEATGKGMQWGPVRVRDRGVFFRLAKADELRGRYGVCVGYVREQFGTLSTMDGAFHANPGPQNEAQTVVVYFSPDGLVLVNHEAEPVPVDGRIPASSPRSNKVVTTTAWERFQATFTPDAQVDKARRFLLRTLRERPDVIDERGRSVLVYGLVVGDQLNTRGDAILAHLDSTGTLLPTYTVGRPYRKERVLAWFCGPHLHLAKTDGTPLMARPIPHPVGHEFVFFRPWRGPHMHVLSLRRRFGADAFTLFLGPGSYTLRPRRLDLKWVLIDQAPGAAPTFTMLDDAGRFHPLEPDNVAPTPPTKARQAQVRAFLGTSASSALVRDLSWRFGPSTLDWLCSVAPRPPSDDLLQLLILGLWSRWSQLALPVHQPDCIEHAAAWWQEVVESASFNILCNSLQAGHTTVTHGALSCEALPGQLRLAWPLLHPHMASWAQHVEALGSDRGYRAWDASRSIVVAAP